MLHNPTHIEIFAAFQTGKIAGTPGSSLMVSIYDTCRLGKICVYWSTGRMSCEGVATGKGKCFLLPPIHLL